MMRRAITIGTLLSILLSLFPAMVGAQARAAQQCFSETGFCVEGGFLDYWNAHGGLAINGYPLTNVRWQKLEDGKYYRVQWFERVRMEYHPEHAGTPSEILLGQFGRAIHPADPPVGPQPGMRHFPETGHNVPGDFMGYWVANGGLPQFGYPLSEVFRERLENGQEYEVQYFERARFERHPGNSPPNHILLGQFGRRILTEPWGPVLAPLANNYFTHTDGQGRFTARVPTSWGARQDLSPNAVIYRAPEMWGAELAINDGACFGTIVEAEDIVEGQVNTRPNYRLISLDKVNIGPHRAYRRVFQHLNSDSPPIPETIIRIDFLVGPDLYTVNGFMEPHDYGRIAPLIDGIAGSVAAVQQPPRPCP
jgi:hypothetical protein